MKRINRTGRVRYTQKQRAAAIEEARKLVQEAINARQDLIIARILEIYFGADKEIFLSHNIPAIKKWLQENDVDMVYEQYSSSMMQRRLVFLQHREEVCALVQEQVIKFQCGQKVAEFSFTVKEKKTGKVYPIEFADGEIITKEI